jgi:hypothetical protein
MKKLLCFVVSFLLLACVGCAPEKDAGNIVSIYVYHSSFGLTDTEYKIDLANEKFYSFRISRDNRTERDPALANEGFKTVELLQKDKIEPFREAAKKYGLAGWDDAYVDKVILDGHQWGITINFDDGTVKKIIGSNAYPEQWDNMNSAFKELTGVDILD